MVLYLLAKLKLCVVVQFFKGIMWILQSSEAIYVPKFKQKLIAIKILRIFIRCGLLYGSIDMYQWQRPKINNMFDNIQ